MSHEPSPALDCSARLDATMKFIGQRSFRDMIAQRRAIECAQESERVKKCQRKKKLERHGLSARRGKGFDSSKDTPGSTPGSSALQTARDARRQNALLSGGVSRASADTTDEPAPSR